MHSHSSFTFFILTLRIAFFIETMALLSSTDPAAITQSQLSEGIFILITTMQCTDSTIITVCHFLTTQLQPPLVN